MEAFGNKFIRQLVEETLCEFSKQEKSVFLDIPFPQVYCNICFFPLERDESRHCLRWEIDQKVIFDFPISWGFEEELIIDNEKDFKLLKMLKGDEGVLLRELISVSDDECSVLKVSHYNQEWIGISFSTKDLQDLMNKLLNLRRDQVVA